MVKEQPAPARAHYLFGVYLMLTEKTPTPPIGLLPGESPGRGSA